MAQNGGLKPSASARMLMPPYPDRFYAAARYAAIPGTVEVDPGSENTTPYSDLTCLALYSLYQQAANGPCEQPKPWAWNIVELAKWQSWKELGNMNTMEAMRLFVRALEEEDPDWWLKAQELEAQAAAAAAEAAEAHPERVPLSKDASSPSPGKTGALPGAFTSPHTPQPNGVAGARPKLDASPLPPSVTTLATQLVDACGNVNTWAAVPTGGRRPSARYQHASIIMNDKMVIIGGNTGRFVNDVQALDLPTLTWSRLEITSSETGKGSLPSCAGHALATLDSTTLLIVGGHNKAGSKSLEEGMRVVSLDLETSSWRALKTTGDIPAARGGHSATRVGDTLWIFGGEDKARHLLADVYCLDLNALVWKRFEARGATPSPRCDHCATVYNDRYLTIFGGGSHSFCYNDVHFLDLETGEWSVAEVHGAVPSPRAGHAGVAVGSSWFIVGGGDNTCGLCDTMLLDLDSLTWSTVTTAQERTAISSEGLAVVPVESPRGMLLLAFGGYNGKYNNELLVLRPDPSLLALKEPVPPMSPAAQTVSGAGRPGSTRREAVALDGQQNSGGVAGVSTQPAAAGTSPGALHFPHVPATAAIVVSGMASSPKPEDAHPPTSPADHPATTFAVMPGSRPAAPKAVSEAVVPRAADPVVEVLEKELEEAQASSRRLEDIVFKERANAIETAAEARADAWAAINKSQQEIQEMREKMAQAVAARQQAEDEAAESAARAVAAQAAVAAAQAEAQKLRKDLAEARGKAQEAQAELARIGKDAELSKVRQDFAVCKQALAEAEQEVQATRALFSAEQARCFKLEVEVAELRQSLSEMSDLRAELELLRRQKEASEDAAAAAAAKASRGGWSMFS